MIHPLLCSLHTLQTPTSLRYSASLIQNFILFLTSDMPRIHLPKMFAQIILLPALDLYANYHLSVTFPVYCFIFYLLLLLFQNYACGIWEFPDQELNGICSFGPTPQLQPQPQQIQAAPVIYTAACGNAISLTH